MSVSGELQGPTGTKNTGFEEEIFCGVGDYPFVLLFTTFGISRAGKKGIYKFGFSLAATAQHACVYYEFRKTCARSVMDIWSLKQPFEEFSPFHKLWIADANKFCYYEQDKTITCLIDIWSSERRTRPFCKVRIVEYWIIKSSNQIIFLRHLKFRARPFCKLRMAEAN